jgi:hypothetical protein
MCGHILVSKIVIRGNNKSLSKWPSKPCFLKLSLSDNRLVQAKRINVRYTPNRKTIHSKLQQHFATYQLDLEERGGKADVTKLITYMGITHQRWNALIKEGHQPMLCEAASYAAYMMIDINDLYENIPYPTKKAA